jgi:hypothetical protein
VAYNPLERIFLAVINPLQRLLRERKWDFCATVAVNLLFVLGTIPVLVLGTWFLSSTTAEKMGWMPSVGFVVMLFLIGVTFCLLCIQAYVAFPKSPKLKDLPPARNGRVKPARVIANDRKGTAK